MALNYQWKLAGMQGMANPSSVEKRNANRAGDPVDKFIESQDG